MTPFRRLVRNEPEAIGSLFARLIEDGRRYARAEIAFYKQVTIRRVAGAKTAVILAVAAIFLAQSALTALLVGIGLSLARWLGPGGGTVAVAVVGLIVAGLLLRSAAARFSVAASADAAVADAAEHAK